MPMPKSEPKPEPKIKPKPKDKWARILALVGFCLNT
jgi:hypothetical protein